MKYVILLGDGFGGYPLLEHGGRTTLEIAETPNIDFLSSNGEVGTVKTTPDGFPPGSDVTNLSILGYDPRKCYTGRSPLEAVNLGIELGDGDISLRCNLVTLSDKGCLLLDSLEPGLAMDDYSAGHISTEEARKIMARLEEQLGTGKISFHPGTSYRHITVLKNCSSVSMKTTPPHDITGKTIGGCLPVGDNSGILTGLMEDAISILRADPVNLNRIKEGKKPANAIWFWGEGKAARLPRFKDMFAIEGAMISAVDLLKGLARCSGIENLDVPGATGYLDSNFKGKVEYALESLKKRPLVYLHIEAPDEAAHMGCFDSKVEAIERFDEAVVGGIINGLGADEDFRLLVLCDHYTPLEIMTHTADPVPFIIYDNMNRVHGMPVFSEKEAGKGIYIDEGWQLMPRFLSGNPA